MNNTIQCLIIAGESSGDLHGASLVQEIQKLNQNIQFFGIGGDRMKAAGVSLIEHNDKMSVVGFSEVLPKYRHIRKIFNKTMQYAGTIKPARAILIDYPGFNLRLSKALHKLNIPVTYFIPPQLWAWHEGRISFLKNYVNQILCILPFEKKWYKERFVDVTFIGHPLLDQPSNIISKDEFVSKHQMKNDHSIIGFFPGSRQNEVDRHLPLMIETVEMLKEKGYPVQAVVGKYQGVSFPNHLTKNVCVETSSPQSVLLHSDAAIIASGTTTLEAALFGTPSVIIYKLSAVSWFVVNMLAKIKYAGIPNLILEKEVMPELLQNNALPSKISDKIEEILFWDEKRLNIKSELGKIKSLCGQPGATARGAKMIVEKIEGSPKNQ
tara:strand:- start:30866 stop:32005 length:1140 start_codon:yes stop_codon:yes gene_type:complete